MISTKQKLRGRKKKKSRTVKFDCAYQITETRRYIPGVGNVRVYGIFAFSGKGLTRYADKNDFCFIYDISDDLARVQKIARTLCENRVEPIHIRDVIEDMFM